MSFSISLVAKDPEKLRVALVAEAARFHDGMPPAFLAAIEEQIAKLLPAPATGYAHHLEASGHYQYGQGSGSFSINAIRLVE